MKNLVSVIAAMLIAITACNPPKKSPAESVTPPILTEKNAVYYWKTVFRLDSAERSFLKRHNIGRIYLRMFDVSVDHCASSVENKTIPNATVKIDDSEYYEMDRSFSDMEFVPVVYITLDALKAMNGAEGTLASNIVTRVRNMCQYNNLPGVHEIQLDCDWTTSTEKSFFNLCDSVRHILKELKLPWRLSSTIRLHQLSGKVPPVDNGVLMVYNTGSFNDPDAVNSIIDAADVKPYLKHLSSFSLHLDIAYPTYSWQLLFRNRHFIGLLNGLNLSDTTAFSRANINSYVAQKDIPHNNRIIRTGDIIRSETSSIHDIEKVRDMIEQRLSLIPHSNIIYHLDSSNLSNYSDDEIQHIFSSSR